jgi:hypothetical protein
MLVGKAYANPVIINYSNDFLWSTSVFGKTPIWVPILTAFIALSLSSFFKALINLSNP